MARIDLDKLHRILEKARAARLPVRDLDERIREARTGEAQCRTAIERYFAERGRAMPDEVAVLLALPPEEAAKVDSATLKSQWVSLETYRDLMGYRDARQRLSAMLATAQAHADGINTPLATLPEWLASRGFPNFVRDYQ